MKKDKRNQMASASTDDDDNDNIINRKMHTLTLTRNAQNLDSKQTNLYDKGMTKISLQFNNNPIDSKIEE